MLRRIYREQVILHFNPGREELAISTFEMDWDVGQRYVFQSCEQVNSHSDYSACSIPWGAEGSNTFHGSLLYLSTLNGSAYFDGCLSRHPLTRAWYAMDRSRGTSPQAD